MESGHFVPHLPQSLSEIHPRDVIYFCLYKGKNHDWTGLRKSFCGEDSLKPTGPFEQAMKCSNDFLGGK